MLLGGKSLGLRYCDYLEACMVSVGDSTIVRSLRTLE